jgi:hypothetical protein
LVILELVTLELAILELVTLGLEPLELVTLVFIKMVKKQLLRLFFLYIK